MFNRNIFEDMKIKLPNQNECVILPIKKKILRNISVFSDYH